MGMTNEEREKHIRIANMLIGAINDLERPMLMYQVEKNVAKAALKGYIVALEQEDDLDKVKAKIKQEYEIESEHLYGLGLERALFIIDEFIKE